MKIAIFAALPQELKPIIKSLKAKPTGKNINLYFAKQNQSEYILALTGVGIHNASKVVKHTVEEFHPELIMSIGFGGALYHGAKKGDVVMASKVISIPSGHILELEDSQLLDTKKGTFVTIEQWMTKSSVSKHIPPDTDYPVCEMETFPIASYAIEKSINFVALRAITDLYTEEIPFAPSEVTDSSGHFSFIRSILLMIKKPWLILTMLHLMKSSKLAAQNLKNKLKK
ncbi:MAG: hypothetical protein L3V56_00105 [Candidatus Magnetoovum sp. WYHC-5]|nr:hypothetical protein [Candidatus Magnetoovum sp. WYHC-5]